MHVQDRKLLQIDNLATTVDAAPLAAANASSSVLGSSLSPSDNDTQPHSILSNVISAYKSKFNKTLVTSTPSASNASASATANATADSNGGDYYMTPCSSGPTPSQYEAFVEVRALCA